MFESVAPDINHVEQDVTAMGMERNGELLLFGLNNGIVREKNGKFTRFGPRSGLPGLIISMTETADGKVWIGAREQGLHYVNQELVAVFPGELPDRKVNALLEVGGHELWIGTDGGLVGWDENTEARIYKELSTRKS
jgi:ligand-binding sensor domain-containing protein